MKIDEDMEMEVGAVHSLTVHDSTHVVIPDVIRISVVVGADNADIARELEVVENHYEELCRRGDVSDFAQARVQADRLATAMRDRADASETIDSSLLIRPSAKSCSIIDSSVFFSKSTSLYVVTPIQKSGRCGLCSIPLCVRLCNTR